MLTDAYVYVCCDTDGCSNQEEIELAATARGWDDRGLEAEIEGMGWTIKDDNHYCPDCSEEEEAQHGSI